MAAKMTDEASSSSSQWKYDVFLSFRGEDTRTSFTDHLFTALVRDEIQTFRDDEELEGGADISSTLINAIKSSRIAIIVFSKNYASSAWCLNELVKILECKNYGQIEMVLPIFYKVDPLDVKHQKNTFAEAFVKHERRNQEMVKTWKAALTEAANLSEWDQLHSANGHEAELVKKIVEKVLTIVNPTKLYVAAYPVGLDSHIEHISRLINKRSDTVHIIGIYGLSGIGKTTIMKAVFNVMYQNFEGGSFLANVREMANQRNGLAHLQKQLLCDVLKRNDINIRNEDRGIMIIKERLRSKKVLIVLDDVNKTRQLDKLIGKHGWFGPGSRVVIITKDLHFLNRVEVDKKYKVTEMDQNESLQLFSYHAFRQNHPLEDYVELSNEVVRYAGGLPLALVILGSLLLDKRGRDVWKVELEKLRKIPNGEILEVLKLSYDALDDLDRNIFLDLSCFFIGRHIDEAIPILDACGMCPKDRIRYLIGKSLVTIDKKKRLHMHDLIQEMGREIVRKQSPNNPGERSRLWIHEDALDVLTDLTGTGAVECLKVDLSIARETKLRLTTEAFSKMPNLRVLRIGGTSSLKWEHSHCDQTFFFENMAWLHWDYFPFEHIPTNFHLRKLVALEMRSSKLKEVWKETEFLEKLKVLDLTSSKYLTRTPDFSGLPNLEKLILKYCPSLNEVHDSIGRLSKLVELELKDCSNLRDLPSGISKLTSLETLDISGCSKLEFLPEGIGKLSSLTKLGACGTAIEELPSSIELLKNLTTFEYSAPPIQSRSSSSSSPAATSTPIPTPTPPPPPAAAPSPSPLGECFIEIPKKLATCCFGAPTEMELQFSSMGLQSSLLEARKRNVALLTYSLPSFHSLRCLTLPGCNLTDDDIPGDLWKLSHLKTLDLRRNDFRSLPSSICQLSKLEILNLRACESLQSLPMLPSSLCAINAECCSSLELLPNLSNLNHLRTLELSKCSKLNEIEGLNGLESGQTIRLICCDNLDPKRIFQEISKDCRNRDICEMYLGGNEIPEWFEFQNESTSTTCQITLEYSREIQGLILCTVQPCENEWVCDYPRVVVHNQSKNFRWERYNSFHTYYYFDGVDHIWVMKIPHCVWKSIAECGDVINVSFEQAPAFTHCLKWETHAMKKLGLHLLYKSQEKECEEIPKQPQADNTERRMSLPPLQGRGKAFSSVPYVRFPNQL